MVGIVLLLFGLCIVATCWIALHNSEVIDLPRWRRVVPRVALVIFAGQALALPISAQVAERTSATDYNGNAHLLVIAASLSLLLLLLTGFSVVAVRHWATKSLFAACGAFWSAAWALSALRLFSFS